jgi:hypothetical protein
MDCQESLPPYRAPEEVFRLGLFVTQPDPDDIQRDLSNVTAGKGGLGFTVDLENVFDETLLDTARAALGALEIWWNDDPSVTATIPLTRKDELVTREIAWDGFVALDPGDSIHFAVAWRWLRDDAGRGVWTLLRPEPSPGGGFLYPPMRFTAQARLQLFDEVPAAYSEPVSFTLRFLDR